MFWAQKSSYNGYEPAKYIIGELYGSIKEQYSSPKRYELYKDSAKDGCYDAIKKLGLISEITSHDNINNIFEDEFICNKSDEIYNNYKKSAFQGDAYSSYVMGYMNHVGFRTEQNIENAKKWYKRASELGHRKSSHLLDCIYERELKSYNFFSVNKSFEFALQNVRYGFKRYDQIIEKYENLDLSYNNSKILQNMKSSLGVCERILKNIDWEPQSTSIGNDKISTAQFIIDEERLSDESSVILTDSCIVDSLKNLWDIPYSTILQICQSNCWHWNGAMNADLIYGNLGFNAIKINDLDNKYQNIDEIPNNTIINITGHVFCKKNDQYIDMQNPIYCSNIRQFNNNLPSNYRPEKNSEQDKAQIFSEFKKGTRMLPNKIIKIHMSSDMTEQLDEMKKHENLFIEDGNNTPPFKYCETLGTFIPVPVSRTIREILL